MSATLKARLRAFFQPAEEKNEFDQRLGLSLAETENGFLVGTQPAFSLPRDRQGYDRQQCMLDSLDAWRFNPIARRIVELTTQYAVGGGMVVTCADKATNAFISEFWQHRLNRISDKINAFSNELCQSGNLFLMLSSDQSGMTYLRVVPATDVLEIQSRENDIEQELAYHIRQSGSTEALVCPAYDPNNDELDRHGHLPDVILHFAINRPSGSQWGEGDLAPVLKWISRYSAWLEDRVRLNRFRNAFVYVVKARFGSENERYARQLQLTGNPPAPGSVLVTDESEEWSVLAPRLEALDASSDGLAIKKMIAAGVGLPLHFLAEPESSTKTTAEAAGSPTYRRFSERQRFLCLMVETVLRVVVSRRALHDPTIKPAAQISVEGGDVSSRDNRELAQAGQQINQVAAGLLERGLIDQREYLRLVYRFMGERVPEQTGSDDE
jgi:hypothetical protein